MVFTLSLQTSRADVDAGRLYLPDYRELDYAISNTRVATIH